jgi:hypothetical protein
MAHSMGMGPNFACTVCKRRGLLGNLVLIMVSLRVRLVYDRIQWGDAFGYQPFVC